MMTKLSELKAGDLVVTDGGFTCIGEAVTKIVKADAEGELYIDCNEGEHYLEGQVDDCEHCGEDFLIGLVKL